MNIDTILNVNVSLPHSFTSLCIAYTAYVIKIYLYICFNAACILICRKLPDKLMYIVASLRKIIHPLGVFINQVIPLEINITK